MAIGTITTLEGSAKVEKPNGDIVELSEGDTVDSNDIIITDENSGTTIEFVDKSTLVVTENGKITLDEMVYDPSTQEGNFAIDLVSGIFVYISGDIAKTDPNAMTLNTPVATIGIRGTQLGVKIFEGETTFTLMAEADGTVGELIITDLFGNVIVLNQEGQTVKATAEGGLGEITTLSFEEIGEIFDLPLEHLARSGSYNGNPYDNSSESKQDDGSDLADFNTEAGGDSVEGGDFFSENFTQIGLDSNPTVGIIPPTPFYQNEVPTYDSRTQTVSVDRDNRRDDQSVVNIETPIEVVIQTPVKFEKTVVSTTTTFETTTNTSRGEETLLSTIYEDDVSRENDLENNREVITTDRQYTDTYNTLVTTTTSITPVYLITYSDGTTEIEDGETTINKQETTETRTDTRTEQIVQYESVQVTTNYETQITTSIISTNTNTSYIDDTQKENDLENNITNVEVTRNYTDTMIETVSEKTITTPVYTISYSDGTTEIEYGEPTIEENIYDKEPEETTRSEIIYTGTEEPNIITTYNTVTETNILDPVLVDSEVSSEFDTKKDGRNKQDITTETITTVETYNTETVTTTTETPVYTIVYFDGTTETEFGESNSTSSSKFETNTETTYSTGSVTYEDWTIGTGANNGFGNGDQDAPGNSGDNNNAENSTMSLSGFGIEEDESIDLSNILGPEPDPVIEETKSNKGKGKGKVEENVGESLIFSGESYTTTISDDVITSLEYT
jgi:hypothetical protein